MVLDLAARENRVYCRGEVASFRFGAFIMRGSIHALDGFCRAREFCWALGSVIASDALHVGDIIIYRPEHISAGAEFCLSFPPFILILGVEQ